MSLNFDTFGGSSNLAKCSHLFTTRVRRMGKVLFSQACVYPQGYPVKGSFPVHWSQVLSRSTPVPGSFPVHWSQVLSRGYPSPRFFPRSLVRGPFQGDTPVLAGGTPGWGTPARTGLDTSLARSRWGTPPGQNSRASTCYAAGGMPLAFTQEDFLFLDLTLQKCDGCLPHELLLIITFTQYVTLTDVSR